MVTIHFSGADPLQGMYTDSYTIPARVVRSCSDYASRGFPGRGFFFPTGYNQATSSLATIGGHQMDISVEIPAAQFHGPGTYDQNGFEDSGVVAVDNDDFGGSGETGLLTLHADASGTLMLSNLTARGGSKSESAIASWTCSGGGSIPSGPGLTFDVTFAFTGSNTVQGTTVNTTTVGPGAPIASCSDYAQRGIPGPGGDGTLPVPGGSTSAQGKAVSIGGEIVPYTGPGTFPLGPGVSIKIGSDSFDACASQGSMATVRPDGSGTITFKNAITGGFGGPSESRTLSWTCH